MRFAYPATLESDDGSIAVSFDRLPGSTWGATEGEALTRAEDLLVTALSTFVEAGKPIPAPPAAKGRPVVGVPSLVAAKLALHGAMLAAGISNVELGHQIGLDERAVRRLRDPLHRSHIGSVETALRALGRRLEVQAFPA
ncbi:putative Antitoxin HicB 2 (plasmid) [Rhodovastum atsumiense]|uniref:Type II toxin-antitoxin system HicB family antitoxin n=1 Tax=Rhodovastum atsumiense TaxID=504468 RepID=A0A5M6IUT8_9PROT|nr:hypothetical protein [Rhodovastum atsumiense]KAA5611627.1 hypothetical protein F1189_13790 [Rhodovastum atsumiense]CAH2606281.1 putative Antitoxin HicB 2 [Rhodovastum atsumiense]